MEYTTIEIRVPVGYEQQVKDIAQRKVESIISQAILAPTSQKRAEFDAEIMKARQENGR